MIVTDRVETAPALHDAEQAAVCLRLGAVGSQRQEGQETKALLSLTTSSREARQRRRRPCLFIVVFALLATAPAFSFNFQPLSQDFSPSGPGATRSFEVTNTGEKEIAVKITMVTRQMSESGHETYAPASNLFIVFPSQMVLRSGTSQTVRVRWTGPSDIKTEQNYRIIAAQLPVNFGETQRSGGAINVLFRYLGAVYVVPRGAHPDVVVDSARIGTGPDGKHGLSFSFKNKGSAHEILNHLTITVSGESTSGSPITRTFEPDALKGIDGANILAGSVRKFFLPVTGELPQKGLHVEFSVH